MQWVILIGNEELTIDKLYNITYERECEKNYVNSNKIVVNYESEHIFYEYTPEIINDYELEELEKIPFINPHFIMMIYTSEKLMKSILIEKDFPKDIYIDDDDGNILPISKFVASYKADSN